MCRGARRRGNSRCAAARKAAVRATPFDALVAMTVAWHSTGMRLLVTLVLVLGSVGSATAHVMVVPTTSTAGAVERYTVIVPTEGKSPTVRVEVRLPMGIEVVAIESKPGWQGTNRPFP